MTPTTVPLNAHCDYCANAHRNHCAKAVPLLTATVTTVPRPVATLSTHASNACVSMHADLRTLSLVLRPSHPSVYRLQYALVLQALATNNGGVKAGNEATEL